MYLFWRNSDRKDLTKAATVGLNQKVYHSARKCDVNCLRKLLKGDLIAKNAVYHLACLSKFYRRAEALDREVSENNTLMIIKAQCFNELLGYVEDQCGTRTVLSMAKLTSLYDKRLASLGYPESHCHTTQCRQDIVSIFPDIKEVEKLSGCWELMFDLDLHNTVEELRDSTSGDMRTSAQAAKILHRDRLLVHRIILQYIRIWLCCPNAVVISTRVTGWSWNRCQYPTSFIGEDCALSNTNHHA